MLNCCNIRPARRSNSVTASNIGGIFATVVVVSDGETYQVASGYEDYAGAERGLMICDDDGTRTTINETDERLVFVERGTA